MKRLIFTALICAAATAVFAQSTDSTSFASAAVIEAAIGKMESEMKPGRGFLWRPLVQGDGSIAALEYWRKPGRPAIHPDEAEYAS